MHFSLGNFFNYFLHLISANVICFITEVSSRQADYSAMESVRSLE